MAFNLLTAGYELVGLSRHCEVRDQLVERGARAALDVETACSDADVIITMLPDSPDVAEVVLGERGVLNSAKPGSLYIDMSTVSPDVEREIALEGRRKGIRSLDAPVSGGEKGAIDATLSIMVGGEKEDFLLAMPIFKALGSTIAHVGPNGAGQTVKAANQLIIAGAIEVLSEAIVFLQASGVEMDAAMTVLAGGLAGSRIMEAKSQAMIASQFTPGFRLDLHRKDLGIVLDAAKRAGVAVPATGLTAQLFAAAVSQGLGHQDHSALIEVLKGLSAQA
jgi:2-hydroxy-3-oxopropionate reductase